MADKLSPNSLVPAPDLYFMLGGESGKNIKILDATYALPNPPLSPKEAFLEGHIPNAQFFDIDAVADHSNPLPHMLPSKEYFESCISALGISNDDHVVVYDQSGAYMASARTWWMFRTFGHNQVYVLNGGLEAWKFGGFALERGAEKTLPPSQFKSRFRPELVLNRDDILNNITSNNFTLLDARPAARFAGHAPEPRAGMKSGHIPDSLNLPFLNLIDPRTREILTADEIEYALAPLEMTKSESVGATCGSGVTACVIALALFAARGQDVAIYDGSWSEWGQESQNNPIDQSA